MMNNISGVYIIKNSVNGKVYIGASRDIYNRLCMHKWKLRTNTHVNEHLQNAFNKYGESAFTFETFEECDEEVIYSQENYWCNMLNTHNRNYGYNVDPTGPDGKTRVSEETRIKMSNAVDKRPVSVYTIYGEFYKEFPDMYKCAEEFDTVAPNVHRKMNQIPKKTLIDSKSSMYIFMDKDRSVNSIKEWYDNVFLLLSASEGKYAIHTCFGTLIGTASSADISKALGVSVTAVSNAVNRNTYIKGLKITRYEGSHNGHRDA